MKKQDASLDASFWINAHHDGLVDHLPIYFDLFAATIVVQEIEYVAPGLTLPTAAGRTFRQWRESGKVIRQEPAQPVDWFHPGENAAIGLARERGYALLIDDQAPYHFAKAHGLPAIASTDFVVLLYLDDLLSYDGAMALLARSDAGVHLKRAAMVALGYLSRQRGE